MSIYTQMASAVQIRADEERAAQSGQAEILDAAAAFILDAARGLEEIAAHPDGSDFSWGDTLDFLHYMREIARRVLGKV